MKRLLLRAVLVGGAAAGAVAVGSARQPAPLPKGPAALPPVGGVAEPGKLKADTAALAREREAAAQDVGPTGPATERAVLQAQLLDLLKRLNERPAPAPASKGANPPPRFEVPDRVRPADAVRMAENLFRDGDLDACLRVLRLTDRTQLGREDRAFAQYLTATCLRKLNKRAEAAAAYREVADAREDEYLAEAAVSQLALMRSAEELEAQLEQLRGRPKSR